MTDALVTGICTIAGGTATGILTLLATQSSRRGNAKQQLRSLRFDLYANVAQSEVEIELCLDKMRDDVRFERRTRWDVTEHPGPIWEQDWARPDEKALFTRFVHQCNQVDLVGGPGVQRTVDELRTAGFRWLESAARSDRLADKRADAFKNLGRDAIELMSKELRGGG